MADLRTFLTRHLGPGFLAGMTLRDWGQLLAQNRFRISPRHWGRAALLTASAPVTSIVGVPEERVVRRRLSDEPMPPPVFILGSWRSGTTHLHTLLCQDDRFGYPNLYQTMYPHTFLLSERCLRPVLQAMTPRKRFMDNMSMSLTEPHEDEMALAIMTGYSNMLSWVFPRSADRYDRYLTFKNTTPAEQTAWKTALRKFVTKVYLKTGKQVVLKSPNHTARIDMILDVFPQAKFLHIHRNPFDVYRSMNHMARQVIPMWGLQKYDMSRVPEMVLRSYKELYGAFHAQRPHIPEGQFAEVSFEEVIDTPLETLERIYTELGLPDFEHVRATLQSVVEANADYRPNRHKDLDPQTRHRIVNEWKQSFDVWDYPTRLEQTAAQLDPGN